jgi:hypothetical protein
MQGWHNSNFTGENRVKTGVNMKGCHSSIYKGYNRVKTGVDIRVPQLYLHGVECG